MLLVAFFLVYRLCFSPEGANVVEQKVLEQLKVLRVSLVQEHCFIVALAYVPFTNFVGLVLVKLIHDLLKKREDATSEQVVFVLVGKVHLRHDIEVVATDQEVHRVSVFYLLLYLYVRFEVLDYLYV